MMLARKHTAPRISVVDVHRRMNDQLARRKVSFDAVLTAVYNRIKRQADGGRSDCILEVPAFVSGYPLFDFNACLRHIVLRLSNEGFCVRPYTARHLFVSWSAAWKEEADDANALLYREQIVTTRKRLQRSALPHLDVALQTPSPPAIRPVSRVVQRVVQRGAGVSSARPLPPMSRDAAAPPPRLPALAHDPYSRGILVKPTGKLELVLG
jgi:hypothetical protein